MKFALVVFFTLLASLQPWDIAADPQPHGGRRGGGGGGRRRGGGGGWNRGGGRRYEGRRNRDRWAPSSGRFDYGNGVGMSGNTFGGNPERGTRPNPTAAQVANRSGPPGGITAQVQGGGSSPVNAGGKTTTTTTTAASSANTKPEEKKTGDKDALPAPPKEDATKTDAPKPDATQAADTKTDAAAAGGATDTPKTDALPNAPQPDGDGNMPKPPEDAPPA